MLALYRIYQLLVMLPLMAAVTIVAAVITATGSIAFGGRWWGYYPAKIWARIMCRLTLVSVEVRGRELIDPNTSYVFVANHQGAYDIFSVYGFLGHNFKWMMKRSLEKIPLVGWACKRAGHIYVDHTTHGIAATMKAAQRQLAVQPAGGAADNRRSIRSDAAHVENTASGTHNTHNTSGHRFGRS